MNPRKYVYSIVTCWFEMNSWKKLQISLKCFTWLWNHQKQQSATTLSGRQIPSVMWPRASCTSSSIAVSQYQQQVAIVMAVTDCIVSTTQNDPSHSPAGANMHPHQMHGSSSLPPKRHLISVQPFLQFILLPNAENHMLYYAFHWTAHPLKNTASHVGRSTPPSNTWFLGLTWFCLPNWLTYSSVIFAGLIGVTNEQATLLRLQQQAAFMLCVTQPNNTSLLCNMYNRRPSHHHNIHNSIKL